MGQLVPYSLAKHPELGANLASAAWPRYTSEMRAPEWLKRAALAAHALQATSARQKDATHCVYVVLLHNSARQDPFGLYVGQTSRDPDLRFDQHKAGYKASSAVRRFGVRLLPDLVDHLNPMHRSEALDLEAALANALRRTGVPWVEGGH